LDFALTETQASVAQLASELFTDFGAGSLPVVRAAGQLQLPVDG